MPGVIVDIGTGDGEFVYKLAKQYPDRFIIGIDPNHAGLTNVSSRILQKPGKGGIQNALFVLGSIQNLPYELENTANQVFINFPWGILLKGILLVEDEIWDAIKRLCVQGAYIDILMSYESGREESEFDKQGIPAIDISYLSGVMIPKLEQKGFRPVHVETVAKRDLTKYPSSWAKKLSYGRHRTYYYMRLESV